MENRHFDLKKIICNVSLAIPLFCIFSGKIQDFS